MDIAHKQEFRIRDLPTRSVTLFPSRAQVTRDIKDVPIKPGLNQLTVVGLTPTVDEHSIKVEGAGSAVISDISVELLPNRDIFEDIYPESDDDESSNDSESEDDTDNDDPQDLKDIRDQIQKLRDDQKRAKETVLSAETRLKILDAYCKSLDRKKAVNIDEGIETYRREREKVFDDQMEGTVLERELLRKIRDLERTEYRLKVREGKKARKEAREKARIKDKKRKEKAKKARRDAEARGEKARIRKEREHFWPKKTYTIRISLEAASFTPASSRRASISSSAEPTKVVPDKESSPQSLDDDCTAPTCTLSLTYVTSSAFWAPAYDLQLSTASNSANLCYDARLTNMTSEVWADCKVILSTSQTAFGGVDEQIPHLVPWRVKLLRGYYDGNQIMSSREEAAHKDTWRANQVLQGGDKIRGELFGKKGAQALYQELAVPPPPPQQFRIPSAAPGGAASSFPRHQVLPAPSAPAGTDSRALEFFSRGPQAQKKRHEPARAGDSRFSEDEEVGGHGEGDDLDDDDNTILPEPVPELEFQESLMEESGFTTTYDLPGLKTLKPSSTASKQRVARLTFSAVAFSHTVVAKYKPAAYLKAKLKNGSKITLLKGAAGLTLDGAFLGRSTLPRCSAGANFTINLGVDPAIKVVYPTPDVKRSTTGLLSKSESSMCKRLITLINSRGAGKPVNITVYDQAPVSEDDRLRVDLLVPRLAAGGPAVAAGHPVKDGKEHRDWGRATATLKKAGEISWEVVLNAGKGVKLPVEYEVSLPIGEGVIQC